MFSVIWAGAGQVFQLAHTAFGFFIRVGRQGAPAYKVYAIALVCVGIAEIFGGGHMAYAAVLIASPVCALHEIGRR